MSNHGSIIGLHESSPATTRNARSTPVASVTPGPAPSDNKKLPDGLAGPSNIKPLTSKYLDKNYVEVNGTNFQNMANALAAMDQAQWHAPSNDPSIPNTNEELSEIVKRLVDAFKDMETAKDTADNAYRKRLTPGKKEYYGDWAVENCCWQILVRS